MRCSASGGERERQALEARLRHAQRMEAIGTLAGGIAHDFNNILGAILGYAEMLLARAAPGQPRMAACAGGLKKAGERARDIVDQHPCLQPPQPSSGFVPCACARCSRRRPACCAPPCRPRSTFACVVEAASRRQGCHRAGRAGTAAAGGDEPLHQCRAGDGRAWHHRPRARRRSTLDSRSTRCRMAPLPPAAMFVLTVRDTRPRHGRGDRSSAIFEPFFTTKEVGVRHGARARHGARHRRRSRRRHRCAAARRAPAAPSRSTSAQADGAAGRRRARRRAVCRAATARRSSSSTTRRPLVQLGEEMLAALGYEPVGFDSSAAALAAFRADPQRFDLVLADEVMPGMTGTQVGRGAACDPAGPAGPSDDRLQRPGRITAARCSRDPQEAASVGRHRQRRSRATCIENTRRLRLHRPATASSGIETAPGFRCNPIHPLGNRSETRPLHRWCRKRWSGPPRMRRPGSEGARP